MFTLARFINETHLKKLINYLKYELFCIEIVKLLADRLVNLIKVHPSATATSS